MLKLASTFIPEVVWPHGSAHGRILSININDGVFVRGGDGEAILNAKDSYGETPLADALTSDFDSHCVIEVLLKYGADQEVKDGDGIRLADKIGKKRSYETDPEYETDSDYANESQEEVQFRIRY